MRIWNKIEKTSQSLTFKSVAITAVALLGLNLVFTEVLPRIVLIMYDEDYQRLAVNCEKAIRAAHDAEAKEFDNERLKYMYLDTIRIELLTCTERRFLKEALLSWGVRTSTIRALELQALLKDSRVSARVLTSPLVKPIAE